MSNLPLELPPKRAAGAPLPEAIRLQAREKIAEAVERGNKTWGHLRVWPMAMPTCSFDLRGQSAGQAVTGGVAKKSHLRLNVDLLRSQPEAVLRQVIPHEVAHLLVRYFFSKDSAPHGVEWQRVMRGLGQVPVATHSFDLPSARTVARPYVYRCGCQVHHLTARRHKHRYQCTKCGTPLVFVSGPPTKTPRAALERVAPPPPVPPTPKQLAFAKGLAIRYQTNVPADALADKRALSVWISALTGTSS